MVYTRKQRLRHILTSKLMVLMINKLQHFFVIFINRQQNIINQNI